MGENGLVKNRLCICVCVGGGGGGGGGGEGGLKAKWHGSGVIKREDS